MEEDGDYASSHGNGKPSIVHVSSMTNIEEQLLLIRDAHDGVKFRTIFLHPCSFLFFRRDFFSFFSTSS